MKAMKERLRQALSRRQKRHVVGTNLVPSAVLLPISFKEGQYYILFTERTQKVRYHKGQMSFPGGAHQKSDGTLLATALRECAEEIGLRDDDIEILGELNDTLTNSSGYIISPFVGFIQPRQLKTDGVEIKEIVKVPITALLDKNNRHEETKIINNKAVVSYSYRYQGRVIWGATARILSQFLDIWAGVAGNQSA